MVLLGDVLVGRAEDDLLDLGELVDAVQPPRVLAVRAGLAAEAQRDAGVAQGQALRFERLVAVQADERDLARADQVQLVGRDRVRLLAAQREVAGALHRPLLDHHGRRHELHAALDEGVDREPQHGHLEQRAVADQGVRARARRSGAAPSHSTMPSDVMSSTWSFGVKSNARGVPTRRISTLSSSPLPMGTSGRGRLGTRSIRSW